MSFLRAEANHRVQKSQLLQINSLLNWEHIRVLLGDLGRSGYGPKSYNPIQMIKALILQAWHNVSDPGLEKALRVRLDFMLFTEFESEIPDETTFCRFRNLLTEKNLWEKILLNVHRQLEQRHSIVSPTKGAIIDATIISSAARPQKELKGIPHDRAEDIMDNRVSPLSDSADPDARWLKKGNKSYFGYKGFMVVDAEEGFIQKVHVVPANVSEMTSLPHIIQNFPTRRLYADKGYTSSVNREYLKTEGIKSGIMYKKTKQRPLPYWQRMFNRLISRKRYLVEQGFGTLKRRFQFYRASYMTQAKVQTQMILKSLAFNFLKAVRKVCYI
jgi:transposase, IS5 family